MYEVDIKISKTFSGCCVILVVCLVLSACASRPELVPESAIVPAGVDFSGRWQLRVEPGSRALPGDDADQGVRIPPANSRRATPRRSSRGTARVAVSVFIENGKSLKISQTNAGLFISFDRAVVEEFTFGENRIVSVGPIEARRVSGWQGPKFVIQTLDDDGAILTETWQLEASGNVLVRELAIRKGDKRKFSAKQLFDRT
jgi:hypothetical protein